MDSQELNGNGTNGTEDALPPPPPSIPPNVIPEQVEQVSGRIPEMVKKKSDRLPMARRGLGSRGQKIPLFTNHFKVNVTNLEGQFFHYSVCAAGL